MRIGINARTILPHRMEGVGRFAWETSRQMILDHPEDEFFFFFDRKYDHRFVIAPNVKPIILYPQARHPVLWKIWFERSVANALIKKNIDVFYSPDGFCPVMDKVAEVPMLIVTHDLAYRHYPETIMKSHLPYYKRNVPRFHDRANQVIAVSESTRTDVISSFGLDPKKVAVAYNALSEPPEINKARHIKGEYFLYLGSIHPRKNIIRLLLAFDQWKKNNKSESAKMVIAGRRAFKKENIEKTLKSMSHANDVIFTGMVDEKTKWNLLKYARVFTYISLFEGFGIPLLEAMQMGVPVLTSNYGALAEIGSQASFQVDPKDVDSIVDGMDKVWNDEALRQKLITSGKSHITKFSWKSSSDIIYEKLTELNKKK